MEPTMNEDDTQGNDNSDSGQAGPPGVVMTSEGTRPWTACCMRPCACWVCGRRR